MFVPSPPQGFTTEQGQVIIGRRPTIPLYMGPQGMRPGPAADDKLLAIYPPIAIQSQEALAFSGISLDVSPEDASPVGLTVSTDGLRMFMVGGLNGELFQYNLTIANDLSTATFSGISLDVSPEDTAPSGLTISSNGLRLFMTGATNDRIFQYNLTIANDLSTATFSGMSLDVSPEDVAPVSLTISSNGLILFMAGSANDRIYQYNLTIANDLSTATFSGISLDISPEDTAPLGLTISSNGLEIFMVGTATRKIYQYILTIANDLSTATFSGMSLDISSEDIVAQGLTISSTGLILFMVGIVSDKIHQYNITTVDDYQFYKFYQINPNQILSTQTNPPLVIIDTLGSGILQEASGFDIRVFDSAGSPLDYEVQSVNITTGEIIVWVNMTTVKDSEFVQLVFGNPTATDEQNPAAVWADYLAVFHLDETVFATDSIKDSSPNSFDSTPFNLDITSSVPGKIGDGVFFDPADNTFIQLPRDSLLDNLTNGFIISAWVSRTTATAADTFFGNRISWNAAADSSNMQMRVISGQLYQQSIGPLMMDTLQLFTMHYDTNNDVTFYLDGVNIGTVTGTDPTDVATQNFKIGTILSFNQFWHGIIDEVHLTTTIPANVDDYVMAEFNNQNDNDTFWFRTPLLTKDEDNFLVDDMGRNLVVGQ